MFSYLLKNIPHYDCQINKYAPDFIPNATKIGPPHGDFKLLPQEILRHIGSYIVIQPTSLLAFNSVALLMKKNGRPIYICTKEENELLRLVEKLLKQHKPLLTACNQLGIAKEQNMIDLCRGDGSVYDFEKYDIERAHLFYSISTSHLTYSPNASINQLYKQYEDQLGQVVSSAWSLFDRLELNAVKTDFIYSLIKFLVKLMSFCIESNISLERRPSENCSRIEKLKVIQHKFVPLSEQNDFSYLLLELIHRHWQNTALILSELFSFSKEEAMFLSREAEDGISLEKDGSIEFWPVMQGTNTALRMALDLDDYQYHKYDFDQPNFLSKLMNLGACLNEVDDKGEPTWFCLLESAWPKEKDKAKLKRLESFLQHGTQTNSFDIDQRNTSGSNGLLELLNTHNLGEDELSRMALLLKCGANPDSLVQLEKPILHVIIDEDYQYYVKGNMSISANKKAMIRLLMEKSPLDLSAKNKHGISFREMADVLLQ